LAAFFGSNLDPGFKLVIVAHHRSEVFEKAKALQIVLFGAIALGSTIDSAKIAAL
jgi:hypothetical protein